MPWLSLLFMIIRYLPAAIELIKAIIDAFKKDPSKFSAEDFHEVRAAARNVHRHGSDENKRRLHEVLERLRGKAV